MMVCLARMLNVDADAKARKKKRKKSVGKFFTFDIKDMSKFAKYRIFASVIGNGLILLFVDVIGLKYWQYMIFGVPFNFMLSYFTNKKAFEKETNQQYATKNVRKR